MSVQVVTSDTIKTSRQAAELVDRVENRKIDLLIGTQMLSKGYHFPYLTLVGVVDADLGLAGGDLRATERTYQMLYQVSGRAGRGQRPGRVIAQSYMPDNPVIKALSTGDRGDFIEAEILDRQAFGMPPFGRLAGIIISGANEENVNLAANALSRKAPISSDLEVLGPADAPMRILRGKHRRRFLIKAKKGAKLHQQIRRWLKLTKVPQSVRIVVDIDPYNFL